MLAVSSRICSLRSIVVLPCACSQQLHILVGYNIPFPSSFSVRILIDSVVGPSLGPTIGGFLGMAGGWRWVEGFLAACTGMVWILIAFLVPETYAPVLLRKRAQKLSHLTGRCFRSKLDLEGKYAPLSERLKVALSRPWALLFYEPIVLLLTLYAAIVYGVLYMLFAALPIVYQEGRGWNAGVGGLPFLGVMIGTLSGTAYIFYDNKRYIHTQKRHNGNAPPESRLPPCMLSAVSIPIGLIWFAWTNSPEIPWPASVAAFITLGFGMMLVYNSIIGYLIDSYTIYSASVLSSLSVIRYMFGAAFPLFTDQMYRGLGNHWAAMIPGFISVLCIPIPFVFYKYGAAIRSRCKYAAEAQRHARQVQQVGNQSNSAEVSDEAEAGKR